MISSTIKVIVPNDIKSVWYVVTTIENYEWRSDLQDADYINPKEFYEVDLNGFKTNFKITLENPYSRWEFDIDNSRISGHWIGIFTITSEGTQLEFIENISPKKVYLKPFIKSFLKKQQSLYINDLLKRLDCNN